MNRSSAVVVIAAGGALVAIKLALLPMPAGVPTEPIARMTAVVLEGMIVVVTWRAGQGAPAFARALWRCLSIAAVLWTMGFLINTATLFSPALAAATGVFWESTLLTYLIFLVLVVPLTLREDEHDLHFDWQRTLDIAQIAIVTFAAFLVFYYVPQNTEASEARRLQTYIGVHWVRDGFLGLAFLYRGWRSRSRAFGLLQLRLAGFFFLLSAFTTFQSEASWLWHWPPLVLHVIDDLPSLYLLGVAAMWQMPAEEPAAQVAPERSKRGMAWTQLLPVLLPVGVVLMATRVTPAYLRLAWTAVAASFLVYAVRVVLTQWREERTTVALSASEAKYQELVENMAEIVFAMAPEGKVTYISRAVEHILGYRPEELIGKSIFEFVHPEDRTAGAVRMDGLRGGEGGSREWRFLTKTGQVKWLRATSRRVVRDGKVVAIAGVSIDITESKQLQERFWKAFHASPTPMTISRLGDGRYVEVNEQWLRLGNYSRDEVVGHTSTELNIWGATERAQFAAALRERGSLRAMEVKFHFGRGRPFVGLMSAEVVELDGEKCVLASVLDVTDQRAMEEQLHRAQRIEAIGNLSASIAHDFNNLLTVIVGFSQLLKDKVGDDENLRQIEEASERGITLTRQLLAFSRRQVLQPRVVALNEVVQRMEAMLKPLMGSRIRLETSYGADLWEVKADAAQLEQVIMNLAINAKDAMPKGGTLCFKTANITLEEEFAQQNPGARAGEFAMLAVEDSGIGMDQATLQRVFEPFFTTKEAGKGTGLGLSTAYGIVKQSGGYIKVESQLGHGTTFRIYLPRVEAVRPAEMRETGVPDGLRVRTN